MTFLPGDLIRYIIDVYADGHTTYSPPYIVIAIKPDTTPPWLCAYLYPSEDHSAHYIHPADWQLLHRPSTPL